MSGKYDARIAGALAAGTPTLEGVDGYSTAHAWLSTGKGDLSQVPETVAMSAIEAAVRLRKTDLLAALESGPKSLRKAGRAGLHRLKAAGVVVEAPRPSASFTLGAEVITVPPRAVMSAPDMRGYSQIALSCTDAEGTCAVFGLFGGDDGVGKLDHGHLSRSSARKFFDELLAQRGLFEVPFAHALHHALQAIETARAKGVDTHEWDHFHGHVKKSDMDAALAYAPLGELPAVAEEGRLEASDALEPFFGGVPWAISSAAFNTLDEKLSAAKLAGDVAEAIDQGEDPAPIVEAAEQAAEAGVEGAEDESIGDPEADTTFMDAIRAASANVLDDEAVRVDWTRRLEAFATLFRAAGGGDNLTDLQHIGAALRDRVPAERIGLTRSMIRSALFASMMERMQGGQGMGGPDMGDAGSFGDESP